MTPDNVAILLASACGFFLIISLYIAKIATKLDAAVRLASIFILFHAVYIVIAKGFFGYFPFFDSAAPFSLVYGPIFYCILSSIDDNYDDRNDWIHFIPVFIFVPAYAAFMLFPSLIRAYTIPYHILLYSIAGIQLLVYAVYGFVKVIRGGTVDGIFMTGVKIMFITGVIFISYIVGRIFYIYPSGKVSIIHILMLSVAIVIFRFNIKNLKNIDYQKNIQDQTWSQETETIRQKYAKSKVSDEDLEIYFEKLEQLMQMEIYLDNELTLDALSKSMKIPKHHLTQLFAIRLNFNFNQYINQYRIHYAEKLLQSSEDNLSMEDIAYKAGFNSKVSFYRAFKLNLGTSPLEYAKSISKNK